MIYNCDNMHSEKQSKTAPPGLPREQKWLLIFILAGYPVISLVLNLLGAQKPETITSKISDIYLPAMIIQLLIILAIYMVLRIGNAGLFEIGLDHDDLNWSNLIAGIIFFIGAFSVMVIIK